MTSAVADTTLLSNFAHAEEPGLLRQAFPTLVVPNVVYTELQQGERLGRVPRCDWSLVGIRDPKPESWRPVEAVRGDLEAGELACIALALEHRVALLTDDRAARHVAASLGLEVSGTLGVLATLVKLGELLLEQADRHLTRMRERGYRSPLPSVRSLLS